MCLLSYLIVAVYVIDDYQVKHSAEGLVFDMEPGNKKR